jgi:hypothetical protein
MAAADPSADEAIYSLALARLIEIQGPRTPLRVIAVLAKRHDEQTMRALLSEHQMLTGREPGPRLLELQLVMADLDRLAGHADVFCWFDAADKLHGDAVADPAAATAFRLYSSDVTAARAAVDGAGGRVAGQSGEGTLIGTVPAAGLAELLRCDAIQSIRVNEMAG